MRLIERAARGERLPEIAVPDKDRLVRKESAGAENMVRMDVAKQHVAYRSWGRGADGGAHRKTIGEAAAGVSDQDGIVANDKADIGNGVLVGFARVLITSAPDVDTWRNFLEGSGSVGAQAGGDATKAEAVGQRLAAGRAGAEFGHGDILQRVRR